MRSRLCLGPLETLEKEATVTVDSHDYSDWPTRRAWIHQLAVDSRASIASWEVERVKAKAREAKAREVKAKVVGADGRGMKTKTRKNGGVM